MAAASSAQGPAIGRLAPSAVSAAGAQRADAGRTLRKVLPRELKAGSGAGQAAPAKGIVKAGPSDSRAPPAGEAERGEVLLQAVDRLPAGDRAAHAGPQHHEVADARGMTRPAISNHLKRARKPLSDCLKGFGYDVPGEGDA